MHINGRTDSNKTFKQESSRDPEILELTGKFLLIQLRALREQIQSHPRQATTNKSQKCSTRA